MLAGVAWRRGRRVLALVALGAPVLVSTEVQISALLPGRAAGAFLAVCGVATLMAAGPSRRRLGLGVALSTVGLAWDLSAGFLVAPALLHAALSRWRDRRALAALAAGVLPALAWVGAISAYYRLHPDANLHRGSGFGLHLERLGSSLGRLDVYFAWLGPELARWWVLHVAALAAVAGALVWTRRVPFLAAGLLGVSGVVVALATEKVQDGTASAYLGFSRFFLIVPLLIWFLGWLGAEAGVAKRLPAWVGQAVVVVVLVSSVVTAAVRVGGFTDRMGEIDRLAAEVGAPGLTPTPRVAERCADADRAARRYQARLAVFLVDRVSAYACSAHSRVGLATLFPGYDRRTWRMHEENHRARARFLVLDTDENFCAAAGTRLRRCEMVPGMERAVVVGVDPQPVVPVLAALGVEIRPFRGGPAPGARP